MISYTPGWPTQALLQATLSYSTLSYTLPYSIHTSQIHSPYHSFNLHFPYFISHCLLLFTAIFYTCLLHNLSFFDLIMPEYPLVLVLHLHCLFCISLVFFSRPKAMNIWFWKKVILQLSLLLRCWKDLYPHLTNCLNVTFNLISDYHSHCTLDKFLTCDILSIKPQAMTTSFKKNKEEKENQPLSIFSNTKYIHLQQFCFLHSLWTSLLSNRQIFELSPATSEQHGFLLIFFFIILLNVHSLQKPRLSLLGPLFPRLWCAPVQHSWGRFHLCVCFSFLIKLSVILMNKKQTSVALPCSKWRGGCAGV